DAQTAIRHFSDIDTQAFGAGLFNVVLHAGPVISGNTPGNSTNTGTNECRAAAAPDQGTQACANGGARTGAHSGFLALAHLIHAGTTGQQGHHTNASNGSTDTHRYVHFRSPV